MSLSRISIVRLSAVVMVLFVGCGPSSTSPAPDDRGDDTAAEAIQIEAGRNHTCALTPEGAVKCWGYNADGQLGLGDDFNRGDDANEMGDNLPATNIGPLPAIAIAAGDAHTCAILQGGSVKCWGLNDSGQLGLGDFDNRGDDESKMGEMLSAVNLGTNRTAKTIDAGGAHTCVILDNDRVKCWGANGFGQLGLGDQDSRGGTDDSMGENLLAVNLGMGRTAKYLSTGQYHTCAILDDNSVKCWGYNSAGQLGLGNEDDRGGPNDLMGETLPAVNLGTNRTAKALAAGDASTCAILDNDNVKCWGLNDSGQLGLGNEDNRGLTIESMGDALLAVNLGANRTAKSIVVGQSSACAMLDNNEVKCWGNNERGQLGLGSMLHEIENVPTTAIQIGTGKIPQSITTGEFHTCVLLNNGRIKCWGDNDHGQLGLNVGISHLGDLVSLGTEYSVKTVATGYDHACAILNDDSVKCWGLNDQGQLGLNDTKNRGSLNSTMGDALLAVNLGTGRTAKAIATGDGHTCVILDNNNVKCWGNNEEGQLGLDDQQNRGDGTGPTMADLPTVDLGTNLKAIAIAAEKNMTCAIVVTEPSQTSGAIKCWGNNSYGQLGLGNSDGPKTSPTIAVNLGTNITAKAIALGRYHTCALLNDNNVKCWGLNDQGQLGTGDLDFRGENSANMGDALLPVALGTSLTAKAITAGRNHTCAILNDDSVKCWGNNDHGQLGLGNSNSPKTTPTAAVNLGTNIIAKAVAAGGTHTCAIINNDSVKCWGNNTSGQLTVKNMNNLGTHSEEMGDALKKIDFVSERHSLNIDARAHQTCITDNNHQITCWGDNDDGELGLGSKSYIGDEAIDMGDHLGYTSL